VSGERFFTPRSLERVAEAVEWEDVLYWYKDGTSNQSRYMAAMAVLWERWMRGWAIPDFGEALRSADSGNFVEALTRVLNSLEERISQLVGFYQGLWWSVNRGVYSAGRAWGEPDVASWNDEERARMRIEGFASRMGPLLSTMKEETNGSGGTDQG